MSGAPLPHEALVVPVPAAGVEAGFGERGVSLNPPGEAGLTLRLVGWGRGDRRPAVQPVAPARSGARLEYVRDHLTEWWLPLPQGVEQGWTVARPPEGSGPLAFQVALDGAAALEVRPDRARAITRSGRPWSVDRLAAWDATGKVLPTRLDRAGGDLLVLVDDHGAVYPVTVDPVYATAALTLSGTQDYELLGYDVTTAGDVNGDGFADVAIGARAYYQGGRVDLHLGSAAGLSATPATSLNGNGDEFGMTVAGGADVNGDGFDDVVVGAEDRSAVVVYLGSATGLSSSPAGNLTGPADARFGHDLADAGDVNGDGFGDVIIGADLVNNASSPWYEGEVHVCLGSPAGLSADGCTIVPSEGIIQLGFSVSGAGDVNGDGYDDVIAGTNWDLAFVLHGSAAGVTEDGYVQLGDAEGTPAFGHVVGGGGDVNGDGFADVVVSDFEYADGTGRVSIFSGSSAGLSPIASQVLAGPVAGGGFGAAVDMDGDVDGDGFADLVVGATNSAAGGQVYVYHGSPAGLVDDPIVLTEADAGTTLGSSVAMAGDVDADGRGDVIAGASAWGTHATWGSAYLYRGYRDDDRDGYPVEGDCDDQDPQVVPLVEVPGDGVDQDCNGVDLCFVDADGDGSRTEDTVVGVGLDCLGAGEAPASAPAGDCDDLEPATAPGAPEVPGDEVDQDCSGGERCFADADGDGFRTDATVESDDLGCADPGEAAAADPGGDCDDAAAGVSPGASEVAGDGVDQDCDGLDAALPPSGGGGGEGDGKGQEGCGCAQAGSGGSGGWLAVGLLALVLRRR